ncbi:hypothetical protein J8I26_04310 [Herbaspirillum sp. LeCh32-8]|uniref:hypothetical protein n=1 Tax=Herbaspirillum sp. LeCh32-8 TaxID=2821356 RepID=UPI001AE43D5F|nr:hypothetical protein [Herbaspirillum sp. LeCh32-8]MBP0597314.1 hypothetical protein [Herbaspirillum sp. LeCh32-8]
MRSGATLGARPGKREVLDVAEPKKPDRRLDQLLSVRKQRLGRLERERNEARSSWRALRADLVDSKRRWREAAARAQSEWTAARAAFFGMAITNAEFTRAKTVYERMKLEAGRMRLSCATLARDCRRAGADFFSARQRVKDANKQQEKLTVLRDEMKALAAMQDEQA